ncbi:MAG: DUF2027 domain-containing protein [Bacteroides sp.]|nr:DUF2027 domain-containing protein [Bacteroides sp.]MCM1390027.1 DUF2027 domain-containing protein [Bacteroides sp.]
MAQIGDIVRYLNAVGGGRITKIDGNIAYVDEDGFETPVLIKECVVVTPAAPKSTSSPKYVAPKAETAPKSEAKKEEPVKESPEGELLNIVLGYEAEEIKHLTTTEYDAYLVNDSNYALYVTYLTRADGEGWVTRFAGMIEPGYQEHLEHVTRDMVSRIDRIAVQYVAFKPQGEFKMKSPGVVEYAVDNTKFFKLHCFRDNVYFDTPVLAFDIVKNDVPQRPVFIDSSRLEEGLKKKKAVDSVKTQSAPTKAKKQINPDVIEVDLHIDELLDTTAGLSNSDILSVQLKEFNRVMSENVRHPGRKIVFIHGKGEGVLRNAILKELKHKYKTCTAQDASFREYGFGATQVTIR